MSDTVYYPYLGVGRIYARLAGSSAARLPVGNSSELVFEVKENKVKLQDYSQLGGGTYASVSRVESCTAKFKLSDLNKTNVARAVFGTESAVAGDTVADEVVVAHKGALVAFEHIGPTAVEVEASTGSTVYVEGEDYEVRAGGIFIIPGGAITDAESLKVSYTFLSYDKVEALTSGSKILELYFEGLNEALSGAPLVVDAYRMQLSPTKALSLLGDKFAELDMEGELLKDPTKVGTGISQYFRARLARAA